MAVPDALRSLARDPGFWSDFFGEEIYYHTYPSLVSAPEGGPDESTSPPVRLRFPMTPRHRLGLDLSEHLDGFWLRLLDTRRGGKMVIAYNGLDGHPFPWGLRWEEVDLFGRCLALQAPEWSHPGLLVLLLSRAAPVTTDQDAALAFPLLESAWDALGVFGPARINLLLHYCDERLTNMCWRFDEAHGWELRYGYSFRQGGYNAFRFSSSKWNRFVNSVREQTGATVNPERFVRGRAKVERLALALAETADWDRAPALADALEESGCRQVAVLNALRSGVPAQVLWVLELLLGEPHGRLIRRHLGAPTRPLQATHHLEVQLPEEVGPDLVREFRQTLSEQGWGTTYFAGGICAPLPDNKAREAFDTTLVGDTDRGLEVIRRLLAGYGPPEGVGLFSWKERRHLSPAPGSGLAPDPRALAAKAGEVPVFRAPASFTPNLEAERVLAHLATRPLPVRTEGRKVGRTWIEYVTTRDGEVKTRVMEWWPANDRQEEEARRFQEVGDRHSYENLQDLFNQPRRAGRYVVRSGLGGYYSYLAGTDGALTPGLHKALVFTHDEAIRAVIRLAKERPLNLDISLQGPPVVYWEAVPFGYARACHAKFARTKRRPRGRGGAKADARAGLGLGCAAPRSQAAAWFGIGAGQLSPRSLRPHDPVAAVRWFRAAAEQGNAEAQCSLGWCYANGEGVPRDEVEAVRWYRLAAEQGQPSAQINLGWMYERGRGVGQDYGEARRWYSRSAERGNAHAQCNLGEMYQRALGVERDDAEAVRLFRLAADAGHAEAQYDLGCMYEQGRGVPQDPGEALRWYRSAAEQDLPAAVEAVERLSPVDPEA
jgi:TPR repeat protein